MGIEAFCVEFIANPFEISTESLDSVEMGTATNQPWTKLGDDLVGPSECAVSQGLDPLHFGMMRRIVHWK
jgi:hypothetical protein